MRPSPTRFFRFGPYELDTGNGELRKSGLRIRLQDQPFRVLLLLLERQGQIVSREEMRQSLWPADTFVDFDHSLSTIINKIREALGDTATNPRFVETVAKRGYRFVHPAEFVQNALSTPDTLEKDAASSSATSSIIADEPYQREVKSSLLTEAEDLPVVPRLPLRLLFVLIQIMYLSFYVVSLAKLPRVIERLEQSFGDPTLTTSILIVTAVIGLPVRFYCLSAASFDVRSLSRKFRKLFPAVFILDELWALAPFLLAREIGIGLALASTAALIYVPFAQRTVLLMGEISGEHKPPALR
jgi:DNA-binding winged helix-turn-helix (wHTH) protein